MIDPFDNPFEATSASKKAKKFLTLEQIRATIEKEIKEVSLRPVNTWGYTKDDILEHLDNILEEVESICSNC